MKYLVFGSLNIDYVYSVKRVAKEKETIKALKEEIFCGGKGFNQACALAKASSDPIYFAGACGKDGDMLIENMRKLHIKDDYILKTEINTGKALIQVDEKGENSIVIYPGANHEIHEDYIDEVLNHFEEDDVLLLQNEISNINYIIEKASQRKMIICLNPSPFDESIESYEKIDYLFINEVEGEGLTSLKNPNEIIHTLHKRFPNKNIILTLGENGSMFMDQEGNFYQYGIYQRDVVDTTAAGDTFTGYFIEHYLKEKDGLKALKVAAIASGISVSIKGASNSIPFKEEVMSIYQSERD